MSELHVPEGMENAIQVFTREDESISIWDNPNFTATLWLPKDYQPLTRYEQALEARNQHTLSDQEICLLGVVGDAICANEAQLRKYMMPIQSASQTSKMLNKLRKGGYVHRYKCYVRFEDEFEDDDSEEAVEEAKKKEKAPGVFVLGVVGYKLMCHISPRGKSFVNPEKWTNNPTAIQRYVAMNALRQAGTSHRQLSAWKWHPHIGGNVRFQKPFAVMQSKAINGKDRVQFIMERVQMSQTFLEFLKNRLQQYSYLKERFGLIQVDGLRNTEMQVVVISVSSVSLAEFISRQLEVHLYPIDVLFLVDEWLEDTEELSTAFAQGMEDGIVRVKIPFLKSGTAAALKVKS